MQAAWCCMSASKQAMFACKLLQPWLALPGCTSSELLALLLHHAAALTWLCCVLPAWRLRFACSRCAFS